MFRTATREETQLLRDEAARTGDAELLDLCNRALDGDEAAAQAVNEVVTIADALARKLADPH